METILEAVKEHASSERADRVCLADGKGSLTYKELWEQINALAALFKSRFEGREYALISCTQDREYIVSILSCQLSGIIPVPVEKSASPADISMMAEDLLSPVFFIGPKALEGMDFFDTAEILGSYAPADTAFELPDKYSVAEILFTTGTTGKSKGIIITHDNNRAIAENIIYGVEMKADNTELIPMPLSHSHGLRTVYANLFNGSTVVMVNGFSNLLLFYKLMDEYKVTSIDMSPSIFEVIFKLSGQKLAEYKDVIDYVQLGSAPLKEEPKDNLKSVFPDSRLYNFYGSTESGRTCTYDFGHIDPGEYCIGKPSKNARYIFVDKDRNEIKPTKEEPGFIATYGAQNMRGYFNAEELTKSISRDGYIFTSDLGYMDDKGYVFCLGRADYIINRGGLKIDPEEIEDAAKKNPIIRDCACMREEDPLQGQVPVLYIALNGKPDRFNEIEFNDFLKKYLDSKKLPERVKIVQEIPRAENGKILRAKLKEMG